MPVSSLEEKFNTCAVCGRKFDKDRALKVHKHKMGCEELLDNPEIVAKLESLMLLHPSQVLVKEIVQSSNAFIKEVVIAPVKSEQPPVQVPAQVPVEVHPVKMGIKSILVGSLILLEGDAYIIENGAYKMVQVSQVKGTVIKRFVDPQNLAFVELKGDDGVFYTLPEHVIIPPNPYIVPRCKLLRLGPEKVFVNAPKIPDKDAFVAAVYEYAKYRDAKTEATKEYEKADKRNRPVIIEYVEAVGKPKKGLETGTCVVEAGYEVHYSSKTNPPTKMRDDDIIIDYLLDKGFKHALIEVTEYKIKDEVWDQLKASGVIPPEFVQAHDYFKENTPSRTLLVTKI